MSASLMTMPGQMLPGGSGPELHMPNLAVFWPFAVLCLGTILATAAWLLAVSGYVSRKHKSATR